jgi:peptidyl-prolyl cis-trans isomerase D
MALIGTLRTKMTKLVVGLVAIAMIAFIVGTDLFGNGPRSIFGGNKNTVGEIAGHTVSLDEYQSAIQERENNYILSFGRQPGEREQTQIRQEAWELLILRYAITPQFEKVGVTASADEEWDMIQGKNMDENLRSSFSDSTGKFDRNRLMDWMKALDRPEMAQSKERWNIFKKSLIPGRERLKYEYLLVKTNYVTEAEAERQYHMENDVIEAKYLYVPYFAVSDSIIHVTDSDLEDYYNKNKEKYKTDQTRSLSYATFSVVPSAADSSAIKIELDRVVENFKTTTEDSVFASTNTDGKTPYTKYLTSALPTFLSDKKELLKAGTLIGPFLENGSYKIAKVVKVGTDTIYNAKASHILIKWDNETPEGKKAAKDKATKILQEIKGGADFAAKAREFGSDGTASRGGDLGWFSSGQMVKPFQDAVFAAKKTGLLPSLVETQFGYHIIEVTGVKDNTSYTVATVEREITASDETHNEVYIKAEAFASKLSGVDEFKERAKKENLSVFDANDLAPSERRVNNLGDARRVVSWLFRDASTGKVSEVFDLENNYVVAIMTSETKEGFKPLDKVKDEITPLVKNKMKGKIIIEKLGVLKGTLEEMAKAFGSDAQVNSTSDLKMNTNSIAGVGFDPLAIGEAFATESGKRSRPFAGENGVLIIDVQNKTTAPAVADFTMFKTQLLQNETNRASYGVTEALKKAADISDKRYRFF